MTVSLRTIPGGRSGHNGRNGHLAPIGRRDLAPALFRLLSDSAMSRAALASCAAAVAIVDAQGAGWPIAYLNPVFERLFGHLNVDVGGRALLSLIFGAEPLVQDRLLERVGAPHDVCAVHKNGMPLEVEIVLGPVHDSNGRLTHWVLTFADRTELARLRTEVAALRSGRAA